MDQEEIDKLIEDTRQRVAEMQQLRDETMRLLQQTRDATGKSDEATAVSQQQAKPQDGA